MTGVDVKPFTLLPVTSYATILSVHLIPDCSAKITEMSFVRFMHDQGLE